METWIDFGRGPLFRLAFSLMVLGLLRVLVITAIGISEAYRRNSDKIVPWKAVFRQTLGWLAPVGRLWGARPVYSVTSVVFHAGLLTVPLFFAAHVRLWRGAAGLAWPGMPQQMADALTLFTIAAGAGLFCGRVFQKAARALSRLQDFVWPPLLLLPFVTGYLCVHAGLTSKLYQQLMLVHIYAADLILLMIPFTKVAHCVLAPLSQAVTAVAWKFVPGAGEKVAATLGYAELPVWAASARCAAPNPAATEARKEVLAK
ncbi:MAG TPA: hypothetical protein VMB03_23465 [Bryobacteraceae bacterium]|nr:hypothetical protein [Bryobacteraceae bacterium]